MRCKESAPGMPKLLIMDQKTANGVARGEHREYDEFLRVRGDYYTQKTTMMLNLNYSEEQLRLMETEPTPEDYMNDSQQQHEQRKKLLEQLPYLAMSHNHENHLDSMERIRVRRCARLLKLDHDVMGRRAVQIGAGRYPQES